MGHVKLANYSLAYKRIKNAAFGDGGASSTVLFFVSADVDSICAFRMWTVSTLFLFLVRKSRPSVSWCGKSRPKISTVIPNIHSVSRSPVKPLIFTIDSAEVRLHQLRGGACFRDGGYPNRDQNHECIGKFNLVTSCSFLRSIILLGGGCSPRSLTCNRFHVCAIDPIGVDAELWRVVQLGRLHGAFRGCHYLRSGQPSPCEPPQCILEQRDYRLSRQRSGQGTCTGEGCHHLHRSTSSSSSVFPKCVAINRRWAYIRLYPNYRWDVLFFSWLAGWLI